MRHDRMDDKQFWFGKRVLVTGGDGFLASHLIQNLIGQGACVVATIRHARPLNTLRLIQSGQDRDFHPDIEQCDLLDFDGLRRLCERHQIDTIFHLAASAIVSSAANSPMFTIEDNVIGTLNVLEVARMNSIARVIIASTDKTYGDHADDPLEHLPYQENYALRGLDVYSTSKVCADILSQAYSYQFKLPVIILRPCNMYGPGDLNFSRLIPRTIMCLLSGRPPHINQGNASVLREYIYIDDVVEGYLLAAQKILSFYGDHHEHMPAKGKETYGWAAFNLGSYTAAELEHVSACDAIRSVTMVIDLLRGKVADIAPVIKAKPLNFIEIPDQFLDATKFRALGFAPAVRFEDGIERTIAWYRTHVKDVAALAERYM